VATFESTVTIARPVEDVYRFFFEFDKNAGSLGIDSVVKEPEGPTGVGTTFHLREGSRGGEAITPLLKLIGKRVWDKRLVRIKTALETPAG